MYKPRTAKEFRKYIPFVKLKKLGEGSYRFTYSIKDLNAVIKFPYNENGVTIEDSIDHAAHEAMAIKRLLKEKEYKALHRYAPVLHFWDEDTGVIVMAEYEKCKSNFLNRGICEFLENLVEDICPGPYESDIHPDNIGFDTERGQFKLIDMGLIYPH